jgi:hypothetical protein
MLNKTIKKKLNNKINHWLKSISNESLVKDIRRDLVVTGGCFPSMIMNEEPNDYDCYFRTKETVLKVAAYYADLWNQSHGNCEVFVFDGTTNSFYGLNESAEAPDIHESHKQKDRIKMYIPHVGIAGDPKRENPEVAEAEDKDNGKYKPLFISSNAISLSDGIQLVVRFSGEPSQIHDTYDFVHTKAYWCAKEDKVVIPAEVYEAVINKTLIYTGSKYPVCSIFRLRKFISRGWTINAGQIFKICYQVSKLDLDDVTVLEDQLIGVDYFYFITLINKIQEAKENNINIDQGYLERIIDEIFEGEIE